MFLSDLQMQNSKLKQKKNTRLTLVKFQNPNTKETILKHVPETKSLSVRKQNQINILNLEF